jgi:uncharacterized Tic20 family protein
MNPSSDEKLWAALSQILGLAGWGLAVGQLIGPLVIYLVKKDSSAFVGAHARESLNFQISILIYVAVLVALCFTVILAPLAIMAIWALGVLDVVLVIVATIKAASGETWRYPCCLRLV